MIPVGTMDCVEDILSRIRLTGSSFTVIFDACVLYPSLLRDLSMRLAVTDLPSTTSAFSPAHTPPPSADRPRSPDESVSETPSRGHRG